MRITERMQYIFGSCLAIMYYLEITNSKNFIEIRQKIFNLALLLVIFITTIWGCMFEGMRVSQWIFLIDQTFLAVTILCDFKSYVVLIIYSIILAMLILNIMIYGDANFKGLKLVGDFQVGHQDFHTSKSGITCSVYYPMDKDVYNKTISRKRNSRWLRHGNKSLRGLTLATADIGSTTAPPECLFRYLKRVRMHTCQDGKLAKVFEDSGDKSHLTSSLLNS